MWGSIVYDLIVLVRMVINIGLELFVDLKLIKEVGQRVVINIEPGYTSTSAPGDTEFQIRVCYSSPTLCCKIYIKITCLLGRSVRASNKVMRS